MIAKVETTLAEAVTSSDEDDTPTRRVRSTDVDVHKRLERDRVAEHYKKDLDVEEESHSDKPEGDDDMPDLAATDNRLPQYKSLTGVPDLSSRHSTSEIRGHCHLGFG